MNRKLRPDDFTSNRRAEARIAVTTRTIELLPCRATDPGLWSFAPAELTDCSLHGLGVLLAEPMEVGEQFLVKFKAGDGRLRLLLYTVQNCVPPPQQQQQQPARARYRIGARFSGFAAQEYDEDLQAVLAGLSGRP